MFAVPEFSAILDEVIQRYGIDTMKEHYDMWLLKKYGLPW
jgi:hypothetical protein